MQGKPVCDSPVLVAANKDQTQSLPVIFEDSNDLIDDYEINVSGTTQIRRLLFILALSGTGYLHGDGQINAADLLLFQRKFLGL